MFSLLQAWESSDYSGKSDFDSPKKLGPEIRADLQ
jgi:hypothetical protein